MNEPEIDIDILDDNDKDTSLMGANGNGYGILFTFFYNFIKRRNKYILIIYILYKDTVK